MMLFERGVPAARQRRFDVRELLLLLCDLLLLALELLLEPELPVPRRRRGERLRATVRSPRRRGVTVARFVGLAVVGRV